MRKSSFKKRVIVTGGSGFIGSALVKKLLMDETVEVLNIDCLTYAAIPEALEIVSSNPRYHFRKVDIAKQNETMSAFLDFHPNYVFNVAAESHVDNSIASPEKFIHTNIVGTFNVLQGCRKLVEYGYKFNKLIHISTDEVYGSLRGEGLFTERTQYKPNSPYSASKAASDHLVRSWHKTYGLPTVTTNCSNNFGEFQNDEKLIPKVIKNAILEKPIPVYGQGNNIRDWLYVQDHVDALTLIGFSDHVGETFNVGCNNEVKNIDLVCSICDLADEILHQKYSINRSSRELIKFVSDRPGHDFRYALDVSKLNKMLGWKAAHSFSDALRLTVDWYIHRFMED